MDQQPHSDGSTPLTGANRGPATADDLRPEVRARQHRRWTDGTDMESATARLMSDTLIYADPRAPRCRCAAGCSPAPPSAW